MAVLFYATPCDQDNRLFAIPRELRDGICHLAFSHHGHTVDLTATSPPSGAFLLTCQQAFREGRNTYKDAYRDYWTKYLFTADVSKRHFPIDDFDHTRRDDLAQIKHFHSKTCIRSHSLTVDVARGQSGVRWRATRNDCTSNRDYAEVADELCENAELLLDCEDAGLYVLDSAERRRQRWVCCIDWHVVDAIA